MSKAGWVVGALVVASVVATGYVLTRGKTEAPKFRKEKVERGDVTALVTASGTLSAVTTVKVGSQVSGIIARLHANFNSVVKKGEILAELDPTPFRASVDQRRADLERSQVELRKAELDFARAKNLLSQQLLSQQEYDAAKSVRDGAQAAVAQSQAALRQAETNLAYTVISSPIDGVVVDRQYDIGQTVAASFQAPTLFTIAQDLTKMQVLTNIDEADVGRVKEGQTAFFTVDAFPDRNFEGVVSQIRLSPQTVQNVVTYPVVLDVSNPRNELKPGMTANVQIPVQKETGQLRVANAALRFRPAESDLAPEPSPAPKSGETKAGAGTEGAPAVVGATERPGGKSGDTAASEKSAGRPDVSEGRKKRASGEGSKSGGWAGRQGGNGSGKAASRGSREGSVYVEGQDGKLRRVPVRPLLTDGSYTAVASEVLKEGDLIVVGLATARALDLGGSSRAGGSGGGPGRGMRF
ncbi:MAG: efflux RND transporter periplasmic adaptor subunit [Acidobacteria bacterium]|nr:efflux RND transporter periplasmic adaptor subunit [Acidobacteriota bacterium]MCG3193247.1 Multidrug resistance protein MdtA [Thermoanaerobaculia bacterium]